MKPFYKEIFYYNFHTNQKLIDVFIEHSDKISEKSIKLLNHILNAQRIWNNRVSEKEGSFGVWQIHPLEELEKINSVNYKRSCEIIDELDLAMIINYTNTKGVAYKNTVKDILFHVINHSTYHRGQIAADFVQSGIEPLYTDYIAYKR